MTINWQKHNSFKMWTENHQLSDYIPELKEGGLKMATLKEEAQAYEPQQRKTIADLGKVPVVMDLFDGEGKDKKGDPYKYKFIKFEGEEYRVPGKVLGDIKGILLEMENCKFVSVTKSGEGVSTTYQVIPFAGD